MLYLQRPFVLPRKSQSPVAQKLLWCSSSTCRSSFYNRLARNFNTLKFIYVLFFCLMKSSFIAGDASTHTAYTAYRPNKKSTPSTFQRSPEASAVYEETRRRSLLYYENDARGIVMILPVMCSLLFYYKKSEYVEPVLQQRFALRYADN